MRRIKSIAIVVLCLALYSIPMLAIYGISKNETKEYEIKEEHEFKEKAYGQLMEPSRTTIKEYYDVSGNITSNTYRYVKIPKGNIENMKLSVEVEDEVHVGQHIGHIDNTKIYSSCNGIVKEIIFDAEEPKVKVLVFEQLVLNIMTDKETAEKINGVLKDENDNEYEVREKSNQITEEGVAITLNIKKNDNYKFGEKITNIRLYSGKEYVDVLTINKNCVYKKPGTNDYYVRVCNDLGEFLEEKKVDIAYETDDLVCVSGIEEGMQCDSGYKYVINNEEFTFNSDISNESM